LVFKCKDTSNITDGVSDAAKLPFSRIFTGFFLGTFAVSGSLAEQSVGLTMVIVHVEMQLLTS
jgi:hypothetical protein